MGAIRYGCQFYTWQMSGEKYVGKMPHILDVVRQSGFAGIEPDIAMMGPYLNSSDLMKELLEKEGLQLGALCLVCDWRGPEENEEERQRADNLLDYMKAFPGTHLMLCQMPGDDRSDLKERQQNGIACVNAIAKRAAGRGIISSVHPNSPEGSVFRTEDDYKVMVDGIDTKVIGYCPDSGHIVNGGMDVYAIFETYMPLIKHVHLKDIDAAGEWAAMGEGITDFPRLMKMLQDAAYDGWVMIEEESANAEADPDGATLANGKYLAETLLPLVPYVVEK